MTIDEARERYEQYKYEIHNRNDHTHEDALIEVTEFLVRETNDPWYTFDLGGWYYGEKKYDLALKYYELTYELGDRAAASCLGYIWYYGRTGTVDYEKAFRYFSEAAALGDGGGKRKLADMYRNGYFVAKDEAKYRRIIEELYEEHKDDEHAFVELPDILVRLAEIRRQEGRIDEAVEMYLAARDLLQVRMCYTEFFGDITIMESLIGNLYQLIEPDFADLDLFDLFEILKQPGAVRFRWNGNPYTVRAVIEDGTFAVLFQDRWYCSVHELFEKAKLEGKPLYVRYPEIYALEVIHE